jgi:uncharacterized protein YqgV (UPF0045/DUF77 family)
MLVNKDKEKTSKSKLKKDLSSKENIESMRSWIRKIEQATNSVSSRLAAVEKRLSDRKLSSSGNPLSDEEVQGSLQKVIQQIKDKPKNTEIIEISKILDKELTLIKDELINHENDISSIQGQLDTISETLGEIKEGLKQLSTKETQTSVEFQERIGKIERREPPVMKLGDMEIPIEITGIIGGIIAFVIAILVYIGQKEIIVSPLFLVLIGIILIGSAILKTLHMGTSSASIAQDQEVAEVNEV